MKLPDIAQDTRVLDLIGRAVIEDVGSGDVTTLALVPSDAAGEAAILARGEYTVSGTDVVAAVFREVDPGLRCTIHIADGARAGRDATIMTVQGSAAAILTAERTALNFMQRMTGIATMTAGFVAAVGRHGARILDTRKTTPTLRVLEKYAVLCGGGSNHRMGLYDRVLIKDNHRRLWGRTEKGLADAVEHARINCPGIPIQIEVESEEELQDALTARPDWVLLDNMGPDRLRRCVELCAGRALLEASGGITIGNIGPVAATGVDAVSLGCLTHSAPAADLSLEMMS